MDHLADLLQRLRATAVETEPQLDDLAFARVEFAEEREEALDGLLVADDAVRHHGVAVGNDVLETAVLALLDGGVQGDGLQVGKRGARDILIRISHAIH